jgi:hypothetical protein
MEALEHPLAALKRELAEQGQRTMRLGMGPFEAADVASIETLKARHETLKV